jgi:hypothetical protein
MNSPAKSAEADASLAPIDTKALFRVATDIAHVCREIVEKCVIEIAGRKYVRVEGWMALSVAGGTIASIREVKKTDDGIVAVAELRRQSDLAVLATAEGFVGHDEPDWYGGKVERLDKRANPPVLKTFTLEKRAEHAIRSMAQTRAVSRVLRFGFAHVIVLIDANLSTIPAEEVSNDDEPPRTVEPTAPPKTSRETSPRKANPPAEKKEAAKEGAPAGEAGKVAVPRDEVIALREQFRGGKWKDVVLHFGAQSKGKKAGEVELKLLQWWAFEWKCEGFAGRPPSEQDLLVRAAMDVAIEEEPKLSK